MSKGRLSRVRLVGNEVRWLSPIEIPDPATLILYESHQSVKVCSRNGSSQNWDVAGPMGACENESMDSLLGRNNGWRMLRGPKVRDVRPTSKRNFEKHPKAICNLFNL